MNKYLFISILLFASAAVRLPAQTVFQYKRDDATVLFFNKELSQQIPHIIRMYEDGRAIHNGIWNIDTTGKARIQPPMMLVTDWNDDGNGGVTPIPKNIISIGMAPVNFSYFISPSPERYYHLFRHEYTHTVMSDKTAAPDRFWRSFLGGKFTVEPQHPFSALWSYLGTPRWYTPRWYQESIACFMETWLSGGVGRALGGYDEMYFRSIIDSGEKLYSVVGLETEGTSSDFQVGTNSYLYGTRFINYLELKYGLDKMLAFYNRTEDSAPRFNKQFEKVYGENIRDVWDDWRDYEELHQKEQLATIEEYPVTQTKKLSEVALGSMSPMVLDEENDCAYFAVNYPGDMPHIERMDLNTLKRTKVHIVDNPMLYQTCYLTMDKKRQRLIWTTQNSKLRGIRVYDLKKKRIVKKLNFQRCSELVYDNVGDCLYSIFTNQGKVFLCKFDSNLENKTLLYTFPFGLSVFDLDISHDGKYLTATTSGSYAEQNLIRFDLGALHNAKLSYETLYTFKDSNLGQFCFAPGDSTMVGSSYYTGVSNVWSLDLKTKEMSLLSNTRIGLFSPRLRDNGDIIALEFERNGMRPVSFTPKVLKDANAIEMLGQMAYEAHPDELEKLGVSKFKTPKLDFGQIYDSITVYNCFKEFKFVGAYPEISAFRDTKAWNKMTPVLGYRFMFQDPLGLNSLKMSVGLSPWSNNDPVNQYHAQLEWQYWQWTLKAAWNPTSFYDLVGPIQASRKGWMVSIGYDSQDNMLPPSSHKYGASIAAFGMMDALPLYQEIKTDITAFQTADAYYQYSKTRSSLGAVTTEAGIIAGADFYTYLADGKFYPTFGVSCDAGFLLPFMKHTCIWLRSALGHNFGDPASVFGNEYFGGFGNNWVDYRPANRYRSVSSFAGLPIDAIKANSFGKLMAEINLTPIKYNDFGFVNLYPTYTQFSVFSTGLATDPWANGISGTQCKGYVNVGVQVNTEIVLFKFMKTTWSLGYARAFLPDGSNRGDFLFSLKLF